MFLSSISAVSFICSLSLVLLSSGFADSINEADIIPISIDLKKPLRKLDERFVSVALSASIFERGRSVSADQLLGSKRVRILASALAPAYLRVGGTKADFLTFDPTDSSSNSNNGNNGNNGNSGNDNNDGGSIGSNVGTNVGTNVGSNVDNNYTLQKRLERYWSRCGCVNEEPQLDIYRRDQKQVAKREQLSDFINGEESIPNEIERDQRRLHCTDLYCHAKKHHSFHNFSMSGNNWMQLNNFASDTNLNLLFDVNELKRTPADEWDSSNAALLLAFSKAKNITK